MIHSIMNPIAIRAMTMIYSKTLMVSIIGFFPIKVHIHVYFVIPGSARLLGKILSGLMK